MTSSPASRTEGQAAAPGPKVVLALSSLGGPKQLAAALAGPPRPDLCVIVAQRVTAPDQLGILVECLRESSPWRVRTVEADVEPRGGSAYFLLPGFAYRFTGGILRALPVAGLAAVPLDPLFRSAAEADFPCAAAILSGLWTEEDGFEGLQALQERGCDILGTNPSHTALADMVDHLRRAQLIRELHSPKHLFEKFDFEAKPPHTRRFLVVDDEEDVRRTLGELLRVEGIGCDFAPDGLEALRQARRRRYSAVLLDLTMPEMDGMRTLEALRGLDPDLPVLIVTGQGDQGDQGGWSRLQSPNVAGILFKPFSSIELKKFLPRLARKGKPGGGAPTAGE